MANELSSVSPAALSRRVEPTAVELRQEGNNNTQIAQVEHYHSQVTNLIIPQQEREGATNIQWALNNRYYNLFVMGTEKFKQFSSGYIMIQKSRVLTENVSADIKGQINSLSNEAIQFLMSLPTIFAAENENNTYGKSTETQQAYFGFVTNINIQNRCVKVEYQTLNPISQKRLNEMIMELDIEGNNKYNEFDHTHWTVKHVPLVKVLRNAGIMVYAP